MRDATERLLEKLAELDPTEAIDIVTISEHQVQWVRLKPGEVLAEMLLGRRLDTGER